MTTRNSRICFPAGTTRWQTGKTVQWWKAWRKGAWDFSYYNIWSEWKSYDYSLNLNVILINVIPTTEWKSSSRWSRIGCGRPSRTPRRIAPSKTTKQGEDVIFISDCFVEKFFSKLGHSCFNWEEAERESLYILMKQPKTQFFIDPRRCQNEPLKSPMKPVAEEPKPSNPEKKPTPVIPAYVDIHTRHVTAV